MTTDGGRTQAGESVEASEKLKNLGGRRNTFGLTGNSQAMPPGSASAAFRSS